jgi:hypothetical protein
MGTRIRTQTMKNADVRTPVILKCGCAAQGTLSAKGGVRFDPPIPVCVVHDCTEVGGTALDLTGRKARCICGKAVKPSSPALPFFEFRGPGSGHATATCKCGYAATAHRPDSSCTRQTFVPTGPHEFDSFYCGHAGWE